MWNSIRRFWERWLLAVVVAVVVVGSVRWDWHLDTWEWLGAANDEETNSTTFRNFGLIFMSIVAIWLTWRRIKIAAGEARTSRGNLQNARDALNLNYQTLDYNSKRDEKDRKLNQYARASERLGSDGMSARIGAIYELRDLTEQDLEQFHVRTMRMLCAFVRFPPDEADDGAVSAEDLCSRPLRSDVQAAMEVIGGRTDRHIELETKARYRLDLRQANLVRLELRDGNLSGVDLRGSKFWGANLMDADLSECLLQKSDFSSPWVLRGVEPKILIDQSDGIFEALDALQSSDTFMTGVNLSGASMLSAQFPSVNLGGADMSDTNLPDVNMFRAGLVGVDFSGAELVQVDMSRTSLSSADLTGTKMYMVNLSGTDLSGSAAVTLADRTPPKGLTQTQLDQACADTDEPPILDGSSGLVWNDRPCRK